MIPVALQAENVIENQIALSFFFRNSAQMSPFGGPSQGHGVYGIFLQELRVQWVKEEPQRNFIKEYTIGWP